MIEPHSVIASGQFTPGVVEVVVAPDAQEDRRVAIIRRRHWQIARPERAYRKAAGMDRLHGNCVSPADQYCG